MTTPNENAVPDPKSMPVEHIPDTPPVDAAEPAMPITPPPAAPPSATPYAAPPAPPQAYAPANPMPNTWMNIVAFVTGVLGMMIVPIIFGHLGVSASNKGKADFKWMGIVGLILGYLELLVLVVIIIIIVIAAAASVNNS